jgi:hypothetical protein
MGRYTGAEGSVKHNFFQVKEIKDKALDNFQGQVTLSKEIKRRPYDPTIQEPEHSGPAGN